MSKGSLSDMSATTSIPRARDEENHFPARHLNGGFAKRKRVTFGLNGRFAKRKCVIFAKMGDSRRESA